MTVVPKAPQSCDTNIVNTYMFNVCIIYSIALKAN